MAGNGRIAPGQKLSTAVSARAWNRAQDAADIVLAERQTLVAGDAAGLGRAPNVLLVRNDSGVPVPVGGVLRLTVPVPVPLAGSLTSDPPNSDDLAAREFVRRPVIVGQLPNAVNDVVAVALEPVPANATGRFAVGGVFPVKVRRLPGPAEFARPLAGVTHLVSAACGPVRLLYLPTGTPQNPQWALGQM